MLMVHSAMAAMTGAGLSSGPQGQALFTTTGSFIVPAGVTSISAVAIAPGSAAGFFEEEGVTYVASGRGGALAYQVAIPTTPGESLYVEVGLPQGGGSSRIVREFTTLIDATGASVPGQVRYSGGDRRFAELGTAACPGGGAAGYAGDGAQGPFNSSNGGGGASPLGGSGSGASGGANIGNTAGLSYGGGEGINADGTRSPGSSAGPGCVRITWGDGRAYPNTNTGDV